MLLAEKIILADGTESDTQLEIAKGIISGCLERDPKALKMLIEYMEGKAIARTEVNIQTTTINTVFSPDDILNARRLQQEILNGKIKIVDNLIEKTNGSN